MSQQVLDRHVALRRLHGERDRAHGVFLLDADLKLAQLRDVLGDRIAQIEAALVTEKHDCDTGERLRHRVDPEDVVRAQGRAGRAVTKAGRFEVDDAALARDERDGARHPAFLDIGLHHLGDACEPLARQPDLLGLGDREIGGPCGRRGEHDEAEDERADDDSHEDTSRSGDECHRSSHAAMSRPP